MWEQLRTRCKDQEHSLVCLYVNLQDVQTELYNLENLGGSSSVAFSSSRNSTINQTKSPSCELYPILLVTEKQNGDAWI